MRPPQRRLLLWMWSAAFIPAGVALLGALLRAPGKDWWVEYHAGLGSGARAVHQEYRRSGRFVFNKWRKPPADLPKRFKVRYATCLVIERPQSLILQLVSSDRAALSINGAPFRNPAGPAGAARRSNSDHCPSCACTSTRYSTTSQSG